MTTTQPYDYEVRTCKICKTRRFNVAKASKKQCCGDCMQFHKRRLDTVGDVELTKMRDMY